MPFSCKNILPQVSWQAYASCALYACYMLAGCHNNSKPTIAPVKDTTVYYPVNSYLQTQITQVDTVPYYVYRLQVVNGKKDSSTINRMVFDSLAKKFLLPELEESAMKNSFKEAVYEDQSTGSITLTYTPKDTNTTVQSAMVLLDTTSQTVKWIFINTLENKGDSTIIGKMGWKSGESCYLNRLVSYADGRNNQTQLTIVWNKK